MEHLTPHALRRAAELERAAGRKLAAWSPADWRTLDRSERNAARLERQAAKEA